MRRPKSKSNINTVVGLVAAILVVNVLIFFVVVRDKGESKEESPIASAQTQTQLGPTALGGTALGGTSPSQNDLKMEDEESAAAEKPLEFNQPEEESETVTPDEEANEVVETAVESNKSMRHNKHSRGRNDRNDRSRNSKVVETVVVAPPVPAKVEAQSAKTNITTIPSGATVSLDGIFIGKSPIMGLSIASGNHSVAVSYTGYQPQVSRLKVGHGGVERLKIRLAKIEKKIGKTEPLAPAVPTLVVKRVTRAPATPRVGKSTMGSESRGRSLLANSCNSCHSKEGAPRVGTKKYTSSQWNRFFASGKHDRYQRLGGKIGSGQLADVKAYVMSKAADAERNQGAGIR